MNWDFVADVGAKIWVLIFVPIFAWINKKRLEYQSLVQKVDGLEREIKYVNKKIDEDRAERVTRNAEEQQYRENTSETLSKIYDTLQDVRKDTAVNSAKLEERK